MCMLKKNLKYRVVINGDKTVAAQTSILLNDLGTYQGTIAGGSAQECVLLFETEKQNVEDITSLQLKVSDGSTSTVSDAMITEITKRMSFFWKKSCKLSECLI